jgi:hypothetical protein
MFPFLCTAILDAGFIFHCYKLSAAIPGSTLRHEIVPSFLSGQNQMTRCYSLNLECSPKARCQRLGPQPMTLLGSVRNLSGT